MNASEKNRVKYLFPSSRVFLVKERTTNHNLNPNCQRSVGLGDGRTAVEERRRRPRATYGYGKRVLEQLSHLVLLYKLFEGPGDS
ncbi:hypothetical protein SLE2022_329240 [Rubroshorea leprosula]